MGDELIPVYVEENQRLRKMVEHQQQLLSSVDALFKNKENENKNLREENQRLRRMIELQKENK